MFKRLLVAYDGSEESRKALKIALELASKFGSEVHLLTVIDKLPRFAGTVSEVKQTIERATAQIEKQHALAHLIAAEHGVEILCVIQPGSKVEIILNYIENKNCDGVLLGYKAHSGLLRTLRRSTALKIVSHPPCTTILATLQGDYE